MNSLYEHIIAMAPQVELDVVALALALGTGILYVVKKTAIFIWTREKRLEKLFSDVSKIREETETNGGSTLRDSINRLEGAVNYLQRQVLTVEQRLAISFENVMIGTYQTDVDGVCVDVDIPYQRISGRTKDECLGFGWINNIHPQDRSLVRNAWSESVSLGIDFRLQYRFQRPDGKIIPLYGLARPIKHNGKITGYVGMVKAMTDDIDLID